MLTTVALALSLSCMPPSFPPRPEVITRCEGSDRVSRDVEGFEVRRQVNACTVVRCEGADRVRRRSDGAQVSRAVNACTVARCEGRDFVWRATNGVELSRQAWRCGPPPRPARPDAPLRFGLSAR